MGVGVWCRTHQKDDAFPDGCRIVGDTVSMEGDTVPTWRGIWYRMKVTHIR